MTQNIKNYLYQIHFHLFILGLAAVPSTSFAQLQNIEVRGTIEYNLEEVRRYKTKIGLEEALPSSCGVKILSIDYSTQDIDGHPTRASGLIAIPISSRPRNFSTISYQHGTITGGDRVPSNLQQNYSKLIGAVFGGSCFLTVAADYLGLGRNNNFQAYLHAESEATVTRDLLLAAPPFAKSQGVQLDNKLFLWGHSQGAHVTLTLHRLLENQQERTVLFERTGLNLAGSMAAAGPTDLLKSAQISLMDPSANTNTYGALLLYSMNKIYNFSQDFSDYLKWPYTEKLNNLFDGQKTLAEIQKILPEKSEDLFQIQFLNQIKNNIETPFSFHLKQNEVYNWKPTIPLYLIHGRADKDVPFANSVIAIQRMRDLGSQVVRFEDLGEGVDHRGAYLRGMILGTKWFSEL